MEFQFNIEQINQTFLSQGSETPLILLLGLAILLGLFASVTPCALSVLPMNLAYIGTLKIENKFQAFVNASLFVLGVSVVMSSLGLFASFAFAVFNEYRGIINLLVGLFVIAMSLVMMDIVKLPLPHFVKSVPETNPFVVGMLFALVQSPCTSPVLFSVLNLASSTGSQLQSFIIMFVYSLGFTAIIFFASLFSGLMKQLNWFKEHNQIVTRVSGGLLILVGVYYTYLGVKYLVAF